MHGGSDNRGIARLSNLQSVYRLQRLQEDTQRAVAFLQNSIQTAQIIYNYTFYTMTPEQEFKGFKLYAYKALLENQIDYMRKKTEDIPDYTSIPYKVCLQITSELRENYSIIVQHINDYEKELSGQQ